MALSPAQITTAAGVLGVVTTTMFASTSLTISSLTESALLLRPQDGQSLPESRHLARQWKVFESFAHNVSMSALVIGTASLIYAGLKSSTSMTLRRKLFFTSAAFNLLTIPYTLMFMLRKNGELEQRSQTGKKRNLNHIDTYALMQDVSKLGTVRGSLPLLSAIVGALALVI